MARPIYGDRPPSFLSKATLAAELDISESTVDEYVRRGLLPKPIHIGGSVRWRWADVNAALAPLATSPTATTDPFLEGARNAV